MRVDFFNPTEGEAIGTPQFAVLGYRYWQRSFGGSLSVSGKPCTIVGVARADLIGPYTPIESDAYLTLGLGAEHEYPGLFTEKGRAVHAHSRQAQAGLGASASALISSGG